MIQIICFFCPAFLSIKILEIKQNKLYQGIDLLTAYTAFSIGINLICMGIISFVLKHPSYVMNQDIFNASFSCKYLLLCFFISAVLPLIYETGEKFFKKQLILKREERDMNDD